MSRRNFLLAALAASAASLSCKPLEKKDGSDAKFAEYDFSRYGGSVQKCGFHYTGGQIGICVQSGNPPVSDETLKRAGALAETGLKKWVDALVLYHPEAISVVNVHYSTSCGDPGFQQANRIFQVIEVLQGSQRASAGPGLPLTLYEESMTLGTVMHEFGHSFACLGDTYNEATANALGDCMDNTTKAAQPVSVMCRAGYDGSEDLYPDDIDGLITTYEKYVANPDGFTPPTHQTTLPRQADVADAAPASGSTPGFDPPPTIGFPPTTGASRTTGTAVGPGPSMTAGTVNSAAVPHKAGNQTCRCGLGIDLFSLGFCGIFDRASGQVLARTGIVNCAASCAFRGASGATFRRVWNERCLPDSRVK